MTSANGPEAGVWVIAETNAFQTRFAKIVVTDDRGRYVVPDLPAADYQLWVRGYGLADSDKGGRLARQDREPHGEGRAVAGGRRAGVSRDLLVFDAEGAERRRGQEPAGRRESVPRVGQEPVVHRLPPDRPARDAHGAARVRPWHGRLGAAHPVGSGGRPDARVRDEPARRRAAEIPRRLDGSRCSRASCRTRSRRGPKASSATSSPRCATGRRRPSTCTT